MKRVANWLGGVLAFWRRSRDEHLHWRLSRHHEAAELRRSRALAEQALVAELKKRGQQLAHELAVGKTRNSNELAMVKTQCKQDLKDYQQYLQSLDRLKASLQASYTHLPEAMAFTIHHHAKQLLNRMWETEDAQEKLRIEMHLLQFMAAVHEDSQALLEGRGEALPQKALAIIDGDLELK